MAVMLERLGTVLEEVRTLAHDTSAYHRAHERSAAERHDATLASLEVYSERIEELRKRMDAA